MAAYLEGGLSAAERSAFEAHASTCERCLATLAVLAELPPAAAAGPSADASRRWWHGAWPWLAPLSALATAAVIYVAIGPAIPRLGSPGPTVTDQPPPQMASAPAAVEADTPSLPEGVQGVAPDAGRLSRGSDRAKSEAEVPAPRPTGGLPPAAPAPESARSPRVEREDKRAASNEAAFAPAPATPPLPPTEAATRQRVAERAGAADVAGGRAVPETQPVPPAPAGRPVTQEAAGAASSRRLEQAAGTAQTEASPGAAAGLATPPVGTTSTGAGLAERGAAPAARVTPARGAAALWRVGLAGRIQRSDDGGRTWRSQVSGVTSDLFAHDPVGPTTVWVVGARGVVLLTVDGETWLPIEAPADVDLVQVSARDANVATVTSRDGRRFSTADRGRTWTSRN
jgi:hypothetical protein